jgi:D-3-phosphoglycerate dehydrogenase
MLMLSMPLDSLMARIIITDGLAAAAEEELLRAGHEIDSIHHAAEDLAAGAIQGYEAAIIRSATKFTAEVIRSAPSLRLIGRAGVGIDNIDLDEATESGVVVCNTPAASTRSVVEMTIGQLLANVRFSSRSDRTMRRGEWAKKTLRGSEIAGKRLGIIGLGRIGRGVAEVAGSLGMEVHAWSRSLTNAMATEMDIIYHDTPDSLFSTCTHITIHCAHTSETHHLVNSERLEMMPGVAPNGAVCGNHLVNISRGGVADEQALFEALTNGTLSTCAMDVFETEPPDPDSPLLQHPNFTASPHIGAATIEAQMRVGLEIAAAVNDFFEGKRPQSQMNEPKTA